MAPDGSTARLRDRSDVGLSPDLGAKRIGTRSRN